MPDFQFWTEIEIIEQGKTDDALIIKGRQGKNKLRVNFLQKHLLVFTNDKLAEKDNIGCFLIIKDLTGQ